MSTGYVLRSIPQLYASLLKPGKTVILSFVGSRQCELRIPTLCGASWPGPLVLFPRPFCGPLTIARRLVRPRKNLTEETNRIAYT